MYREQKTGPTQSFKLVDMGLVLNGGVNLGRRVGQQVAIEDLCLLSVESISPQRVGLQIAGLRAFDLKHITTPPEVHILLMHHVYGFFGTQVFIKAFPDIVRSTIKLKIRAPREIGIYRAELILP